MKHLHPRAIWLFFFSSIFPFLFLSAFFFWPITMVLTVATSKMSAISQLAPVTYIVASISPIFLLFIWAKLSYRYYKYELIDNGFRKEMGVIYKKYVTIPYDRIQNVDIYRGILARLLGLSDLNIQTAGASAQMSRSGFLIGGAEGRLPGLAHKDAEKLRDELIKRATRSRKQGLQYEYSPLLVMLAAVLTEAGKWLLDSGKNPSKWWQLDNLNRDFLFQYAKPDEFYVGFVNNQPAVAAILQLSSETDEWADID